MLLVLDNQDSFTFNLVQLLQGLGQEVLVRRNDRCSLEELKKLKPSRFLVSPGPGSPGPKDLSVRSLQHFAGRIPVLGVCLGQQALAVAFGGKVGRAQRLMHGKRSPVRHDGRGVFRGLPQDFQAVRYHSLLVDPNALGEGNSASAWTPQGELMGLRHRSGAEGVQFHPESILSECGSLLLSNFLSLR